MFDTNYVTFDNDNVIKEASNIRHGKNPDFTAADFYAMYPQFQGLTEIPEAIFNAYLSFVLDVVNVATWGDHFRLGAALLLAHYLTLYLESQAPEGASAKEIIDSAEMRGVVASKSVGDVSVSYDYNNAVADASKWSGYNLTAFGSQFAILADTFSKGGMYVW